MKRSRNGNVRVQIKPNALLKSAEVAADMRRRGDAIAAAAGEGFEAFSLESRDRASALVVTATADARRAEAENHTLLGAIQAGA